MGDDSNAWREILEEFDSETTFWAQFRLTPEKQAIHAAPWETEANIRTQDTELLTTSNKKLYPYVDGLNDAIGDALRWMKTPPTDLREGLFVLAQGKKPQNLPKIFILYGDYREHLGILYAREFDHAAFSHQRKSGKSSSQKLKRFVASYMEAVARNEKIDRRKNIALLRYRIEEYAKDITLKPSSCPPAFSNIDFSALLTFTPRKEKQPERDCYALKEKFLKELTGPTFEEWIDEVLVLQIQEYALRP